MKRAIVIALIGLTSVGVYGAYAYTTTPTSCTFAAKYTEPTTNRLLGPVNLTGTTIYYTWNNGAEKIIQVPASSVNGGGAITQNITEPCVPGQKYTAAGSVTAKNPNGESIRATLVPLTIDRSAEVAPNPPAAGNFE